MSQLPKCVMKPKIFYELHAVKRDSESREELSRRSTEVFPNVFTNYGVEQILNATVASSVIAAVVGTGNQTPNVTNTRLQSFLRGAYTPGESITSWVDNGDGTCYVESRKSTLFSAGQAMNISEVGSAFSGSVPTANSDLCSRALVLDALGNPTTFEVLADEELELVQFYRRYYSTSVVSTPISVNGVVHQVKTSLWRFGLASSNWPFPAQLGIQTAGAVSKLFVSTGGTPVLTLAPFNSVSDPTSVGGTGNTWFTPGTGPCVAIYEPYVAGSKKRRMGMRINTGALYKVAGGAITPQPLGVWQFAIEPAVEKSALHRFTILFDFFVDNTNAP